MPTECPEEGKIRPHTTVIDNGTCQQFALFGWRFYAGSVVRVGEWSPGWAVQKGVGGVRNNNNKKQKSEAVWQCACDASHGCEAHPPWVKDSPLWSSDRMTVFISHFQLWIPPPPRRRDIQSHTNRAEPTWSIANNITTMMWLRHG